MGDESKHDQQIPDDATVVKTDTSDIASAAEQPPEDATVAAPRSAAAGTMNSKTTSAADNRQDVFTTRPSTSAVSTPPQSALRSLPVAIALGTVTGLVMFGLTALWLLHGR